MLMPSPMSKSELIVSEATPELGVAMTSTLSVLALPPVVDSCS